MALLLGENDVRAVLTMSDAVECIEAATRAHGLAQARNLPSVIDNSGTEDLTMVHRKISTCPNREGCLALSRALLAAGLAGGHDCDCERSAQARLSMRSASPRTGYIASESRQ